MTPDNTTREPGPTLAPRSGSAGSNLSKLERLLDACEGLMEIVEGIRSTRWSFEGARLKDSKEWVEFYLAQRAVHRAAQQQNAKGQP